MSRTDLRAQAAAVPLSTGDLGCVLYRPLGGDSDPLKPVARETYLLWQVPWQRRRSVPPCAVVPVVFPCALAARDRRIAVALEATKSISAIVVAVAVALASSAPPGKPAPSATLAPVNMVILDLPINLTTAAAGAAHCVGGEVVVVVIATPSRVPDVIRAGVVPRVNVYCAIVSVDALSGAAVVRCQSLVLDTVELGRRDDRRRAGRVGRGALDVHVVR
eukprot:scaffold61348_cov55-Phaeocystis_antarctica.AAC.2